MDHALDHSVASHPSGTPQVRRIALSAPLHWLRLGLVDLRRSLAPSLWLGVAVSVAGLVLLGLSWKATYLAPAMLGGFLLVGPFVASVVYVLSRQLERGDPPDATAVRDAWHANGSSIALFGLALALAYVFWERMAAIIFASLYRGEPIHLSRLVSDLVLSGQYLGLLGAFFAAGALLAAIVFAVSVVSAPLLMDRPVDAVTAMITSLRCCARNAAPLALWAVLVALITALGMAAFMVGLVIVFPWLAHASWHAYRDLVET